MAGFHQLRVLLVIPLYNHGGAIKNVTQAALNTGYPVLVVDDGSSDGGLDHLVDLDCKSLRLPVNQGKGEAIKAAARFAAENGFEAIVTIDADGQHDPSEAPALIANAHEGPWPKVVIGARKMVQETVPDSSHFGKKFSNFWVRLESGKELEDTQSGMRLYPVRELLALKLGRSRYDFEIEVLVKLLWGGVPAESVAVSVHYPPADERISHFDKLKDNVRLSLLHASLVTRRLLPFPHHRLVDRDPEEKKNALVIGNPIKTLGRLCRESSSPFWLAVAVWFGIFLGALPLIACHTVAIIYVAYRLHFNKIAAVAASQFCMPPVVPALCIEVGYFMRTGEFLLDLSWERWLLEVHQRLWEWFLGSLIVGPVLGGIGALLMYILARRFQRART